MVATFLLLAACTSTTETSSQSDSEPEMTTDNSLEQSDNIAGDQINKSNSSNKSLSFNRKLIKLGHTVNTSANEYIPVLTADEQRLIFSAMDRTGFFDFKLDFTKQKSAGGEDIFYSEKVNEIWTDARPLTALNTNAHEIVSQVLKNGDLVITGNYPEKLGPKGNKPETQTCDLFIAKKNGSDYRIMHLPEPVNSIYGEYDAWMSENGSWILFVSDRPGHQGDYHKKGLKWNNDNWGNTDVYVSVMDGDFWGIPINLGKVVNTQGAERTPWLSADGLTLYVSSNTYGKDLNVYAFKRNNINNWTDWDGPYEITDANSDYDDWGYKEDKQGNAYLARVIPLGFKPTQGGASGDAGFRETNFRTGYEVFGQQVAALKAENTTDIYMLQKDQAPILTLPDLFFEFNSAALKKEFEPQLTKVLDFINQNKNYKIEIHGHTDNLGKPDYNQKLSEKRAESVRTFLTQNGATNEFIIKGFGEKVPLNQNKTETDRALNRRVEIFFNY